MVGTWGLEEYRALHFAVAKQATSPTHFLTACSRNVDLGPVSVRRAHQLIVCAGCFSAREPIWVPMDEQEQKPRDPFDDDSL